MIPFQKDEEWRPVPGSKCTISNYARLRNPHGRIMTPWYQSRVKHPKKRVVYLVKTGTYRKQIQPAYAMPEVWPELEEREYNAAWVESIRTWNRLERAAKRKPRNTNTGNVTTHRRNLIEFQGWDYDPWDTMHLWNTERDYFNQAQYLPCI